VVPFTPCKLRNTGETPIYAGTFLLAKTLAYRVDNVAGRTLHVTRWPLDEVPEDAEQIEWMWDRR
jgi:hypothetical protein